eukprot:CAMPEP_0184865680 /NCGR_PEP_ID=MMETSP0580-20130426/18794_1 /TAXON_ID=1118495 /ORGANISM="Dactyliosolen fragilissimus" /LENGTH=597 /DNA_ID=CAMNT_0027364973 /DNA_START=64 /DNA_END=1857 /DNA_ORIENTATION=-
MSSYTTIRSSASKLARKSTGVIAKGIIGSVDCSAALSPKLLSTNLISLRASLHGESIARKGNLTSGNKNLIESANHKTFSDVATYADVSNDSCDGDATFNFQSQFTNSEMSRSSLNEYSQPDVSEGFNNPKFPYANDGDKKKKIRGENFDATKISLEELYRLNAQQCTPLSLSNMYKYASANATSRNYFSQRLRNAKFLHRELPIRIAHRAVDLLTLPHGLNETKEVREIVDIYLSYLNQFKKFPVPTTKEEEHAFTDMLRPMVLDRSSIPMAIARGVSRLKNDRKEDLDVYRLNEMEEALYRFFTARIGLRLLTEHHILSCNTMIKENEELRCQQSFIEEKISSLDSEEGENKFLGCIKANCDPVMEVERVSRQVTADCRECYGIAPIIEILDCTPHNFREKNFTYIPHHLQYMIAELLKNSCRATIQQFLNGKTTQEDHTSFKAHHGEVNNVETQVTTDSSLPPIRVVVVKGAEDVAIKIADKGGGVARSVVDRMWTFAHSTLSDEVQSKENDTGFENDEFSGKNIRGFGLPLSRIYARYFGGELTLKSMEGYGVDTYLYLSMLGEECENLPKKVLTSPANSDSSVVENDIKDIF